MTRQKWTVSALAVELRRDRRFIAATVQDIEPVKTRGRWKYYLMADVIASLLERDDLDLTAEKARLAKEQADRIELENAVRRGELIPAQEVEDVVGAQIANARARLLGLGSAIAPQIAVEGDVIECQHLVDARVREVLGELKEFNAGDYGDS